MTERRYSKEEVARIGREIYEQKLRSGLEDKFRGDFLLVEIETGDYEIDKDDFAASNRARQKHPNGIFFGMRIGYRSSGTIGASALPKF